jgi:hypothetical protein
MMDKFGLIPGTRLYGASVATLRAALKAAEAARLPRFPYAVRIESTNLCNARCINCTREIMTRATGVMEMGLFKKIVDECAENRAGVIHLHNFGEPFLDRQVFDKIRYIRDRGLKTRLFTNLSVFNREMAAQLIETGLSRIKISIDGADRETFESIRRGLKYDKVVENIETLLDEKKRCGSKFPKVGLVFVETDQNCGQTDVFKQMWKGRVDSIHIMKHHNWGGAATASIGATPSVIGGATTGVIGGAAKTSNGAAPDSVENRPDARSLDLRAMPCLRIWRTFTILYNGEAALCCMDYDGLVKLGDVTKNTIREIFMGQRLKKIKSWHLSGRFDRIPICARCEARR